MDSRNKNQRTFQGVVTSDAMNKTRTVQVSRTAIHPRYKKRFTVSKKYLVHDEKNEYHVGDMVRFVPTRPLSRQKRWRIIGKVEGK